MRLILFIFLLSSFFAKSQSAPGAWYWSQLANVVGSAPPGCPRVGIVAYAGFEGTANPFDITDQACCSYSLTLSTLFAKFGNGSLKTDLRITDPLVSSSVRAEAVLDGSNSASSEAWFGWSIYVPSDWVVDNQYPEGIIQWHQQPNVSGVEPIGIWIDGANFEMVITKGLNVGNNYIVMAPVKKGQWNTFVCHIKWDAGTNGFVQTWIDGVQYANYTGVTNYPNQGYYIKMGIYKWFWQDRPAAVVTERIYYYDEFRMGDQTSNYCSVLPG